MKLRFAAALASLLAALPAGAVYLNPDGMGQALIYPYFTVQSSNGNPYNTYITIVNHTTAAKAVRVRFREGRNSREVASFNLFLSGNDAWAGAVVGAAGSDFARIIAGDSSCASPQFTVGTGESAPGITFGNTYYTGVFGDAFGTDAARTREGFVEVIEMATVVGETASFVAHDAVTGLPANCAAVQGNNNVLVGNPTGGLSGTLTIINVANGMDFTVNAEALAELSTTPFYRPAADPYPDLNAIEITDVSVVTANGFVYRSTWNRGVDAVSAALTRSSFAGELILEQGTNSRTEFAVSFPTRHYYFAAGNNPEPFSPTCVTSDSNRGEPMTLAMYDREERLGPQAATRFACLTSPVFEFGRAAHTPATPTLLLGSQNGATSATNVVQSGAQSGWARVDIGGASRALMSLNTSQRMNIFNSTVTSGAHTYTGLAVVGFSVRSFENGTLTCSGGTCQGNYGGGFPLKYTRTITP